MARRKQRTVPAFLLFDVMYEDGQRSSNRRVPGSELDEADSNASARAFIESQDHEISKRSGKACRSIKSVSRSPGQWGIEESTHLNEGVAPSHRYSFETMTSTQRFAFWRRKCSAKALFARWSGGVPMKNPRNAGLAKKAMPSGVTGRRCVSAWIEKGIERGARIAGARSAGNYHDNARSDSRDDTS